MAISQIQETINTKSGIASTMGVAGTGSTVHLWFESIAPYLVTAVWIASFLSLMSIFIINLPKMLKVLSSPFNKKK